MLNDAVFEYFGEAANYSGKGPLTNKLWFGRFSKYEKSFKWNNLSEVVKDAKGKSPNEQNVSMMVTHRSLVDYRNEPFENYTTLYFDVLPTEYLPLWCNTNTLYTFKNSHKLKDDVNAPFSEMISLM